MQIVRIWVEMGRSQFATEAFVHFRLAQQI